MARQYPGERSFISNPQALSTGSAMPQLRRGAMIRVPRRQETPQWVSSKPHSHLGTTPASTAAVSMVSIRLTGCRSTYPSSSWRGTTKDQDRQPQPQHPRRRRGDQRCEKRPYGAAAQEIPRGEGHVRRHGAIGSESTRGVSRRVAWCCTKCFAP